MKRHFDDVLLGSIELFCLAAEAGSFTAAALAAGVTPASVSRSISRLEKRLGVRLFVRSTRSIRLTEGGKTYFEQCRQALNLLVEAERKVTGEQVQPAGTLRISTPTTYGHHRLLPLLPARPAGRTTRMYAEAPVSPRLRIHLAAAAEAEGIAIARGGTYVCMEGPQFSTKAESNLYRSWGADVIGMTNLQEAKLAREAEICYGTLAMVTDYDCWHPGHDSVTTEQIVAVLNQNSAAALKVLDGAVAAMPAKRNCPCQSALKNAILTQPSMVSDKTKQRLHLLLEKYFRD